MSVLMLSYLWKSKGHGYWHVVIMDISTGRFRHQERCPLISRTFSRVESFEERLQFLKL